MEKKGPQPFKLTFTLLYDRDHFTLLLLPVKMFSLIDARRKGCAWPEVVWQPLLDVRGSSNKSGS